MIASTEAMTHYRELTSGERKWDTSKECTVLLWLAKRYVSGQCSEEIKPVDLSMVEFCLAEGISQSFRQAVSQ